MNENIANINKYNTLTYKWIVCLPVIAYFLIIMLDKLISDYSDLVGLAFFITIITLSFSTLIVILLIILSTKKNKLFYAMILLLNILIYIHIASQIIVN
jgi:hypothetical protein